MSPSVASDDVSRWQPRASSVWHPIAHRTHNKHFKHRHSPLVLHKPKARRLTVAAPNAPVASAAIANSAAGARKGRSLSPSFPNGVFQFSGSSNVGAQSATTLESPLPARPASASSGFFDSSASLTSLNVSLGDAGGGHAAQLPRSCRSPHSAASQSSLSATSSSGAAHQRHGDAPGRFSLDAFTFRPSLSTFTTDSDADVMTWTSGSHAPSVSDFSGSVDDVTFDDRGPMTSLSDNMLFTRTNNSQQFNATPMLMTSSLTVTLRSDRLTQQAVRPRSCVTCVGHNDDGESIKCLRARHRPTSSASMTSPSPRRRVPRCRSQPCVFNERKSSGGIKRRRDNRPAIDFRKMSEVSDRPFTSAQHFLFSSSFSPLKCRPSCVFDLLFLPFTSYSASHTPLEA